MLEVSHKRTSSMSKLEPYELNQLITALQHRADSMNNMRRKVLFLAHQLGWKINQSQVDWTRLNGFLTSRSAAKKVLNKQSHTELSDTITQLEHIFSKEVGHA